MPSTCQKEMFIQFILSILANSVGDMITRKHQKLGHTNQTLFSTKCWCFVVLRV